MLRRLPRLKLALYFVFAAVVAAFCYLRPIPGDFDRYMYEVVARNQSQGWADIYPIVKHESPRAEASSVMDSAEHMAQLEPLYAIRPLYIDAIERVRELGFSPQKAINLISAASFFGLALLIALWGGSPFYAAPMILMPSLLELGRGGTPDALNALFVIGGLYALVVHKRLALAMTLLLAAVWVRTDSLLVLLAVLGWLIVTKRLEMWVAAVFSAIGVASVITINHFSGNYGYLVLFRYSFIGGRAPALIPAQLSLREYLMAVPQGLPPLLPQVATYLLLAFAAWKLGSVNREWLLVLGAAALTHFLLFPSGEARYLAWFYVLAGILFIEALRTAGNSYRASRSASPPSLKSAP